MKITRKRKILTTTIYAMNMVVVLLPVLQINNIKCSLVQAIPIILTSDLTRLAEDIGLSGANVVVFEVSLYIQIISILLFTLFSIVYVVLLHLGRNSKFKLVNGICVLVFMIMQMQNEAITALFGISVISAFIPFFLVILTGLEIPVSIIVDQWDEVVAEAKQLDAKEKAFKKEKDERLRFEGKQNRLFYHVLWKNFKSNWKDYSLILISNSILFAVIVISLCVKEILSGNYEIEKIQVLDGLSEIIANAMIPMIILSVFTIIILVFYYIKCRARNFGVFLTLGMRRTTLYFFTAVEFMSVLAVSLLVGGALGRTGLIAIVNTMSNRLNTELTLSDLSAKPYALSIMLILLIYIISFMAARDIFYDFNVGKSTDLRAIAEKMPGKKGVWGLIVGVAICSYSILQYRKLYNFENKYLLLLFFIGLFLIIRYGMALWLSNERKSTSYLKKLMFHNQLFHKSKTNAGFIGILTVTQFCVLFYFAFQFVSTLITEEPETLFPYDFVCYADDNDIELFAEIKEKYQAEICEYPMVRISAYDSTEKNENELQGQKPVQGQHIGISESTYHALKKYIDPSYEAESLGLDPEGENIHIVYQQDKSVKAQPTAFYSPLDEPLLHIGQPCRSLNVWHVRKKDLGYYFYEVKSEEVGSLTGIFRQGIRENIIVFSDEYFEKARNFWKTTNIRTGEQIENKEDRLIDVTITQGVTKLVLVNTDKYQNEIEKELAAFEQEHLEKETKVYLGFLNAGVYDSTVAYHYGKTEAIESIKTERTMKTVMNLAAIILFFMMNLMILIVKMLSERDLNVKRAEFLTSMGMHRKSRIKLVRREIMRYYVIVPALIAVISSIIYTLAVFHARMYSNTDIQIYLGYFLPIVSIYLLIHFTVTFIITAIYAHRVEGLRYGRNS